MDVGALAEVHLTKQPRLSDAADEDIRADVAVVLGHHVLGAAGLLGGHDGLALIDGDGRGHFGEDMHPALQGGDALLRMERHGRADDNHIYLARVQHLAEVEVDAFDAVLLGDRPHALLVDVADRMDMGARMGVERSEEALPPPGRADDADS